MKPLHYLIVGLRPALQSMATRIAIPSLVVGAALAFVQPCAAISFQFEETGSLAVARDSGTAVLLPNGKVLVVGGMLGSASIADAELYDPASATWSTTGSLVVATKNHTATLLLNGKVLVAGGYGPSSALKTAQLYDPAARHLVPHRAVSTRHAGNTPRRSCLARPVLSERLEVAAVEWRKAPLESWSAKAQDQMPNVMVVANANYTLPAISDQPGDWTATSTTNAPSARENPTAVWTGSEITVWGDRSVMDLSSEQIINNPGATLICYRIHENNTLRSKLEQSKPVAFKMPRFAICTFTSSKQQRSTACY